MNWTDEMFLADLIARDHLTEEQYDHSRRVAEGEVGLIFKPAALLHDVLEDSPEPLRAAMEIKTLMPPMTLSIVLALTKKPGKTYMEYIKDIERFGNIGALYIKMADLRDHLAQEDTLLPTLKKRYEKALNILEGRKS